jgi:hypothetical protein
MAVKSSKCFTPVRGKAMRATKLDACGRPVFSDEGSVTTDGFVSISFTANTDEGEEINVTNAAGNTCVRDTPCPKFLNYTVEIEFCNVDPYLFAMLTGQDVITIPDPDSPGDEIAIGFAVCTTNDGCAQGFALEVWTGAPGVACDEDASADAQAGGYILLPYLQGGVVGDFTIENDAVSFTVTGAATKDGAKWGSGPYGVYEGTDGVGGLPVPVTSCQHLYVIQTTVAPPAAMCGPTPTLNPASDDVTSLVTAPGLAPNAVVFTPDPEADPGENGLNAYWVDFGDGSWDYNDGSGPLEHTYEAEGTYTVTVYRGTSSYSTTITVPLEES